MTTMLYLPANRTAGYSGFVLYSAPYAPLHQVCVWMIPGTFFDDWDNQ